MSTPALCQCGCGKPVRIAPVNDRSKGWIKGQPLKYLKGHGAVVATRQRAADAIGSRTASTHGYVLIKVGPGRRQYEHDVIAERALGRPLKRFGVGHPQNEVVHHVNGVKTDNRPENLLVCTHEYHVALHHRLEVSPAWPEFQPVSRPGFGKGRRVQP